MVPMKNMRTHWRSAAPMARYCRCMICVRVRLLAMPAFASSGRRSGKSVFIVNQKMATAL